MVRSGARRSELVESGGNHEGFSGSIVSVSRRLSFCQREVSRAFLRTTGPSMEVRYNFMNDLEADLSTGAALEEITVSMRKLSSIGQRESGYKSVAPS